MLMVATLTECYSETYRFGQASLVAFVKTPSYSCHQFPKELDEDGDASIVDQSLLQRR